ncbi:UvrD-helicase domain-containing protein [Legionella tunisiensis]|uniref:UvrD-helicase domain-containing protein n=1 Tax=Legionella tunisiensis TaxID=1034944 RepID=UPI0002F533C7|nr:UvrD-helicase domain-containing protein [Legionella tunisiensis]
MLKDSQQRLQATDPRQSFIVQAPAGSGKTEILTQRYLRLLGNVNEPEQIVALTFTRKAASEMRERIILALQQAASGTLPASSHQQQTYGYAVEALNRSTERGWQLLQQSGRLRIITIDSLCQTLCQAIPLQEKQVPYAQISEYPERHYQAAARACLAHALSDKNLHHPLKCLLQHLDNRQDKLLELLGGLTNQSRSMVNPFIFCS